MARGAGGAAARTSQKNGSVANERHAHLASLSPSSPPFTASASETRGDNAFGLARRRESRLVGAQASEVEKLSDRSSAMR